jgi:hypothetical protein
MNNYVCKCKSVTKCFTILRFLIREKARLRLTSHSGAFLTTYGRRKNYFGFIFLGRLSLMWQCSLARRNWSSAMKLLLGNLVWHKNVLSYICYFKPGKFEDRGSMLCTIIILCNICQLWAKKLAFFKNQCYDHFLQKLAVLWVTNTNVYKNIF